MITVYMRADKLYQASVIYYYAPDHNTSACGEMSSCSGFNCWLIWRCHLSVGNYDGRFSFVVVAVDCVYERCLYTIADSFNMLDMHKSSNINNFKVIHVISFIFIPLHLYIFQAGVWFLCPLALFYAPGGIAGHVEQHRTQVWHDTQWAGSAEQAVLQSGGTWPGVSRRYSYIQPSLLQPPHISSSSPAARSPYSPL